MCGRRALWVCGVWLPGGQWAGHDGGFEPISGTCADPTRDEKVGALIRGLTVLNREDGLKPALSR